MKNKSVLISVYDKQKLDEIAPTLVELGYDIIATSGTSQALKKLNIMTISPAEITQNPNALHDCIQTIGFSISGGILFDRQNKQHLTQIKKLEIRPIDIVICNFPPLKEAVQKPKDFNIHHVDVGGPLMLRSAATNYHWVLPVMDPQDYQETAQRLKNNTVDIDFRKNYAIKAYNYCSQYDAQIVKLLQTYT